jgi:hypothetical protein
LCAFGEDIPDRSPAGELVHSKNLGGTSSDATRCSSPPDERRQDPPLNLWGLTLDDSANLALGGVELRALIDEFGSPLHLADRAQLDANIAEAICTPADVLYNNWRLPAVGFPTPDSLAPSTLDEAVEFTESFEFPIVAKPHTHVAVGADRGSILWSSADLEANKQAIDIEFGHTTAYWAIDLNPWAFGQISLDIAGGNDLRPDCHFSE